MKKIHYILLALLCGSTLTACMDNGEWDEPAAPLAQLYGNPDIKATNVLTIQQLKTKFKNEVNNDGAYKLITESMQIKGIVTANDIQGNMYNEISIQDATGAIFIGVAQGGVNGYLPIGTEILVELKGLYIGNYRQSPTIGTPYTSPTTGATSVSRMSRILWHEHFTYTGYRQNIEPVLFADGSTKTTWNIETDGGKLGILKNVSFKNGGYYDSKSGAYVSNVRFVPGESTYSNPDFSTSWYFKEQPDGSNGGVQIYTSNYADFATLPLPTSKVNITGVFKRYKNQWEIIIRSIDDVVEVK